MGISMLHRILRETVVWVFFLGGISGRQPPSSRIFLNFVSFSCTLWAHLSLNDCLEFVAITIIRQQ